MNQCGTNGGQPQCPDNHDVAGFDNKSGIYLDCNGNVAFDFCIMTQNKPAENVPSSSENRENFVFPVCTPNGARKVNFEALTVAIAKAVQKSMPEPEPCPDAPTQAEYTLGLTPDMKGIQLLKDGTAVGTPVMVQLLVNAALDEAFRTKFQTYFDAAFAQKCPNGCGNSGTTPTPTPSAGSFGGNKA